MFNGFFSTKKCICVPFHETRCRYFHCVLLAEHMPRYSPHAHCIASRGKNRPQDCTSIVLRCVGKTSEQWNVLRLVGRSAAHPSTGTSSDRRSTLQDLSPPFVFVYLTQRGDLALYLELIGSNPTPIRRRTAPTLPPPSVGRTAGRRKM